MLDAGYDERNMYLTKMSWPCYDGKEQCLDDWATWPSSVYSSHWRMMYATTVSYLSATHFGGDDMVAHVTSGRKHLQHDNDVYLLVHHQRRPAAEANTVLGVGHHGRLNPAPGRHVTVTVTEFAATGA
ncbi:hypothetical protein PR001_g22284 [Phytophthora rubi]|uniref:Uncharacterized protein n=1 Tax=Phytophthora rubi TaxID=129364 RepID=A0A6A3J5B8_9STRA|nr:hypothetical protein PR001_g22284 [Phytophthora rubi]